MVSKRRFFILIMMMFVLLFMFQFTQVVKENGNTYDTNLYLQKKENIKTSECQKRQKTVLFIGKKVAAQWCEYTKRRLVTFGSLSECPEETAKQSEIILIQQEAVASDADLDQVLSYTNQGISFVFCNHLVIIINLVLQLFDACAFAYVMDCFDHHCPP